MASISVAPASGAVRESSGNVAGVDRLPEEMNDMKIRDEKVPKHHSISLFLSLYLFIYLFCVPMPIIIFVTCME